MLAVALSACEVARDSGDDTDLSDFVEDGLISGRVMENVRACEVDAVCYLRIEFADTAVTALYGSGERPPSPCAISVEVSDAAFRVEPGDVVEVVISRCASEGRYLRSILVAAG